MQIVWPLDIVRITIVALELLRLSKLSLSHESDAEKHTGAWSWFVNLSRTSPQKWGFPPCSTSCHDFKEETAP